MLFLLAAAFYIITFYTILPPAAFIRSRGALTKLTCLITLLILFGVLDCCIKGGGKSVASMPKRDKPLLF